MNNKNKYDIIVSTGGKCGGRTLFKTFVENGFETFFTHGSYDDGDIKSMEELISIQEKNNIYIFDSYRTPIERHISSFFQNINIHILKPLDKINVDMLIYWYNQCYFDCDNYHPLDTMLNIFNGYEFDFNKEYIKKIIELENKRIIYVKLRFKTIYLWKNILSEILGKDIIIHDDNLSCNKSYVHIYNEFKKKYLVPVNYLNYLISQDTFIRYNTLLERDEYIKEWKNKSMEVDKSAEKINDSMFENIPDDFDVHVYKNKNSLNYTDFNAKIHYELIGFYKKLEYK